MARTKKTFFLLEVSDREYHVQYNGSLGEPKTKEQKKHNERLMRALMASDELLRFVYGIVMPVVRYKRREAKKAERKLRVLSTKEHDYLTESNFER